MTAAYELHPDAQVDLREMIGLHRGGQSCGQRENAEGEVSRSCISRAARGASVRHWADLYFEEEDRFIEAVEEGETSLDRGDYRSHEQVGDRLRRFLLLS